MEIDGLFSQFLFISRRKPSNKICFKKSFYFFTLSVLPKLCFTLNFSKFLQLNRFPFKIIWSGQEKDLDMFSCKNLKNNRIRYDFFKS